MIKFPTRLWLKPHSSACPTLFSVSPPMPYQVLGELLSRSPIKAFSQKPYQLYWRWWFFISRTHPQTSHDLETRYWVCAASSKWAKLSYHQQYDQKHRDRALLLLHDCHYHAKREWEDLDVICSLHRARYRILGAQGCLPSKPVWCIGQGDLLCTLKASQAFGSSLLRLQLRSSSNSVPCLSLWNESQQK